MNGKEYEKLQVILKGSVDLNHAAINEGGQSVETMLAYLKNSRQ